MAAYGAAPYAYSTAEIASIFAVEVHSWVLWQFFCPSVRLSVKRVDCDKTKKNCAHILIGYHMKDCSFLTRKTVGWGDPFYLKFWAEVISLERKYRFSIDIRSYCLSHDT